MATKKKIKSHHHYLRDGVIILIIAVFGFLGYSAFQFQNSEQESEGFFACNKDNTVCELSAHIHAELEMNACGEEVFFSREEGRVDEMHTHKEKNLLHFHTSIKVDPKTREPLPEELFRSSIAGFFVQMEYELPDNCVSNPNPELDVTVNNQPSNLDHIWADGDVITIDYN